VTAASTLLSLVFVLVQGASGEWTDHTPALTLSGGDEWVVGVFLQDFHSAFHSHSRLVIDTSKVWTNVEGSFSSSRRIWPSILSISSKVSSRNDDYLASYRAYLSRSKFKSYGLLLVSCYSFRMLNLVRLTLMLIRHVHRVGSRFINLFPDEIEHYSRL